ncbi:M20 family metallopeptidase [bacterium LRH843]|nr:M20 family metallopeptidase [bacterium LRH843]
MRADEIIKKERMKMDRVINRVLHSFKEKEQIQVFKELLQVRSENPGDYEENMALKIQRILDAEGIPSVLKYVDKKRANFYAILEGEKEGKTLIYNGHLDTVPAGLGWTHAPFSAYEDEGGFIYGRGASDMKAGVASMLYAAICLKRMGYPKTGKIILFFNADEEVFNLGMKQFLTEEMTADFAIISEPTNLNVAIGHRGASRFYVKTKGKAGHACYVKEPNNAIEKMNKLLPALFAWGDKLKKEKVHDFLGTALSNVTMIKGGIAGNIIPDSCVIEIDRRTLPGETREEILKEYEELLTNCGGGIEYELNSYTFLGASLIDQDHNFVKLVQTISEKHYGKCEIQSFEATCEAPFFSVEKGIPTIIYGPGSLEQAHVVNERVHKSQVIIAGKVFIEVAITILGECG